MSEKELKYIVDPRLQEDKIPTKYMVVTMHLDT
jgi:hypothetical protein